MQLDFAAHHMLTPKLLALQVLPNPGSDRAGSDANRDADGGIPAHISEGRSQHRSAENSPYELVRH